MSVESLVRESRDLVDQKGEIIASNKSSILISIYQSLLIKVQILESLSHGDNGKRKKQVMRLLNKISVSLKDDRKKDIAESQLVEANKLIQDWEKSFEQSRSTLLEKSKKMLSLAEQSFQGLQSNGRNLLSSEDQVEYVRDLIAGAKKSLDDNNGATAITMARKAIDALVDDRQQVLSRSSPKALSTDIRTKLVNVLSSVSSRVHHRVFELQDIQGITQTAIRQGVEVIKIAIIAKEQDLTRILAPLVGDVEALQPEELKTQPGLNLFRISVDQKCTLYVAAVPMEKMLSDENQSLNTVGVLDQFRAGLFHINDVKDIDDMEKTALAMTLLRLPENNLRITRNRIGLREEMISLSKSL